MCLLYIYCIHAVVLALVTVTRLKCSCAQVIGMVLQHGDATLQNKAVDILLSSVSHDPTTLRSHMLQDGGRTLFSQLLQLMIDSSDAGLQEQILEVRLLTEHCMCWHCVC